ncbi:glycosyltransferase [Butyrivibrio fibrisolvens]|uniref:glycosyltransferase n=1 Tax=Butyrivibrio fibrisolvens TaxID=831 RepID=UPI0020BDC8A7|nr:glycosyltransferase [Butyrivibrio fibrisolvens]
MKLIQINTVCNTSVGHIMGNIQKAAIEAGFETLSIYGRRKGYKDIPCLKVGNGFSFWAHVILTSVTDLHGLGSYYVTKKIIRVLKYEKPDIIHLHNIHGYYLNYRLLFDYLKNYYQGQIVWTLHDCWAYTGHCAYYTGAGCNRWIDGCYSCPEKGEYPISLMLDESKYNYKAKRNSFTGLNNLTLIVPSKWLEVQVKRSFLKDYPVKVVSNGIDFEIFHPVQQVDIRKKFNIPDNKKILLGVALYWNKRKGMDDFIKLAKILPEVYVIVLVGVSARQRKDLPDNIIGIDRTDNQRELAALYTEAHIFVNPSVEETFSMVTVESMACGTPVIVLDTSAVCELVNEKCGVVLHKETDIPVPANLYMDAINEIDCRMQADEITADTVVLNALKYGVKDQTDKIVELYKNITT